MPKIKTHRGAAKRFNLTKNGKVKMNKSFRRHILNKKTTKTKEKKTKKTTKKSTGTKKSTKKTVPITVMGFFGWRNYLLYWTRFL